jgi:hypothetical protein
MATAEEEPQDIIRFYNLIFIPKMKEHLIAVCAAGSAPASGASTAGVSAAASATGKTSPDINESRGSASPRHVGSSEVYVSHRNPNAHHLTPRTRTLWSFSETPADGAERLRNFNANINATGAAGSAGSADTANALVAMHSSTGAAPASVAAAANGDAGRRTLGGGGSSLASSLKRKHEVFDASQVSASSQRSASSSAAANDDDDDDEDDGESAMDDK